jgi:PTS system N-acetylglucosamine-specific IIC component
MFSGRRFVSMAAAIYAVGLSMILLVLWPWFYRISVYLGTSLQGTGALGVGVYMFLNRLMIPTGLHHALNSVFWFDLAGISDLNHFWNGTGVYGQTGQYMTGFFPVMMFGLPGAALAMYQTAYPEKRKAAGGLLLTAAICSVMTGVTEPMEFAFMFLAPGLFFLHAFLTGLAGFICAILPFRIGFNFSAGLLDYLLSWNSPMAENPWLLWPVGIGFGILYYMVFRFCILKFRLPTPGREREAEK